MANQTGNKNAGRFYIENVSRNFIVPYNEFKINKETSKVVNSLRMTVGRNSDLKVGDEIVVKDNAAGEKKRFGGYLVTKDETQGMWQLEADSYVSEIVGKKVKKVYRDKSPEAILQDLIGNETSLTYFAPVSSGVTLDKYVIEGKVEEAVEDMTDTLDWQARTTPQKEFFFEPRGRLDSEETFTHGQNCVVKKKKTKDSKYVNTVELRAGRTNYTRNNSFTGDGSKTNFELTEVPVGSVDVTVDGVKQSGAIAEDLQSGDDFFIDQEQPELIFGSAPSNGSTIEINYTYEVPILVEATADNAQIPASEREIAATIKRKWIKTFENARQYAKAWVNNHARLVGEVNFFTGFQESPPVGYTAQVVDSNKNVDDTFVVEKKSIDQDGRMTITAGDQEFNAIDWRNRVQRKIRDLEQKKTTNKILTKLVTLDSSYRIDYDIDLTIKKREVNDSFIVGSSSNGVLGQDKLGDRRGSKQTILTTD